MCYAKYTGPRNGVGPRDVHHWEWWNCWSGQFARVIFIIMILTTDDSDSSRQEAFKTWAIYASIGIAKSYFADNIY